MPLPSASLRKDRYELTTRAVFERQVRQLEEQNRANETPLQTLPNTHLSSDTVVAVRIRHSNKQNEHVETSCALFPSGTSIGDITAYRFAEKVRPNKGREVYPTKFHVNQVFGQSGSTQDIWDTMAADLVPLVIGGGVGAIFAYGQTGSGKTFTMEGIQEIVAKSLMGSGDESDVQASLTILELLGDDISDLLNSRHTVRILRDGENKECFKDASTIPIRNHAEMTSLIKGAASLRKTAPTLRNDSSSRSHAICIIRVSRRSHRQGPELPDEGLLYLVDLAGSEFFQDTCGNDRVRREETKKINKSLLALKECIEGMAGVDTDKVTRGKVPGKGRERYINYRANPLTRVLSPLFTPADARQRKTIALTCVSPELQHVGPSIATLKFATRLGSIARRF